MCRKKSQFGKGISRPSHRADWVRLDITDEGFAQPADVDVDGAVVDLGGRASDAVDELISGENAAGTFEQRFEQSVLRRSERDLAAAACDAMGGAVEGNVAM